MKKYFFISLCLLIQNCFSQQTGSITDKRDGKTYKTVVIGNQIWMTEGLKATKFNDGSPIYLAKTAKEWINFLNDKTPAYLVNNVTNEFLYNYYAVNDSRGLAPTYFSIPTMEDFIQLGVNCGGKRNFMVRNDGRQFDWVENVSQLLRNQYWSNPGKNSFGFNANRTGMVQYDGQIDQNDICRFWMKDGDVAFTDKVNEELTYDIYCSRMSPEFPCSKESFRLFNRSMNFNNLFINSGQDPDQGLSVRCIKN